MLFEINPELLLFEGVKNVHWITSKNENENPPSRDNYLVAEDRYI